MIFISLEDFDFAVNCLDCRFFYLFIFFVSYWLGWREKMRVADETTMRPVALSEQRLITGPTDVLYPKFSSSLLTLRSKIAL